MLQGFLFGYRRHMGQSHGVVLLVVHMVPQQELNSQKIRKKTKMQPRIRENAVLKTVIFEITP